MSMQKEFAKIKETSQPFIVVSRNEVLAETFAEDLCKYLRSEESDIIKFDPEEGVKILRGKIAGFSLKPHSSPLRIMLVFRSENLNGEEANTLLKTLEEPPEYGRILLFTRSFSRIIPTVKSRCQKIFISGDFAQSRNSLLSAFESNDLNAFLKKIKDIESEEIPAILEDTMAGLKESNMEQDEMKLFKRLARVLVLVSSTNANGKLALEDVFIWWKSLKER